MPTEMTMRDHFAAAALAGLLANGDYGMESTPGLACGMADAMLRERERLHNDAPAYTSGISAASGSKLTDAEREAIKRLTPRGDLGMTLTFTLTPAERAVFHGLLERLG